MNATDNLTTPQGSQATYADLRAVSYPPIEEQLDMIFHNGFDAWKQTIQSIKDQFPKE